MLYGFPLSTKSKCPRWSSKVHDNLPSQSCFSSYPHGTLCSSHSGTCLLRSPNLTCTLLLQSPQLKFIFPPITHLLPLPSTLVKIIPQSLEEKWSLQDIVTDSCPYSHFTPGEINHFTIVLTKYWACIFIFHFCSLHHSMFSSIVTYISPSMLRKNNSCMSFYMVKWSIHSHQIVCFY